jgi:cytoplasmic iron level regulating protein YaaA (DUF328/UPF0246 family)
LSASSKSSIADLECSPFISSLYFSVLVSWSTQSLMHISDAVSSLNYNRYQCFINNETGDVESAIAASSGKSASAASASPFKPTALVFDGPAYRSFDASSFNAQQYEFAQRHVRILSGLYGVLKPWDLIQEYRLEVLSASFFACLLSLISTSIIPSLHRPDQLFSS